MANRSGDRQAFDGPAHYRICVRGQLTTNWSERLGGMTIRPVQRAEGSAETVLVGELRDQGALLGVLATLYGLHMPLLLVERLAAANQG